jgi:hypothetical protein
MTDTLERKTVYLYGKRYPLASDPQRQVVSTFPQKIVIGDATRSDQQNVSEWVVSDLTGGLGIENMIEAEDINRFWDSDGLWTMDKSGIYLGPLVETMGSFPTGNEIEDIMASGGASTGGLYTLSFDSTNDYHRVHKWNTATSAWDEKAEVAAVSASTVPARFRLMDFGGKIYAYLGEDGYLHSADGTTWTAVTDQGTAYTPVYFDGKLLKTDDDKVYSSSDGATWDAGIDHNFAWLRACLAMRDASSREEMLVLVANGCLYTLDFWTGTISKVADFGEATGTQWGGGSHLYRDELYVPVGGQLYKWSGSTLVSIGLDRDDGVVDSTSATIIRMASRNGVVCGQTLNGLYAYNGVGWHPLFKAATGALMSSAIAFGQTDEDYTKTPFYFGYCVDWANHPLDWTIQSAYLPTSGLAPRRISTWEYAASGTLYTPYFDGGFSEWQKVAVSIKLVCSGMSDDETITVSYMKDDETSWSEMAPVANRDGLTTIEFNGYLGDTFRKIKFKLAFARGSTATKTPILEAFVFRYYRVPDVRYGWQLTLDLSQPFESRAPDTMIADLETAIETEILGTFSTRPGETKYVKILNMVGSEATGEGRQGTYRLTVSEMG